MSSYSLRVHLYYAGCLFYRPEPVFRWFLDETSLLYSFIPFLLYLLLGEVGIFEAYRFGRPLAFSNSPFPTLLPQSLNSLLVWKCTLYLILNLAAVGLFTLVFSLLTRYPFFHGVCPTTAVRFLLFLSLLGIPALLVEMVPRPGILIGIVPLTGLAAWLYLAALVRFQADLPWSKSLLLTLISLVIYYGFRGLTMR